MNTPRWDSFRLTPSIPIKRSWDGEASPSSPPLSSVPRFRERHDSAHIDPLEGLNDKMRRPSEGSNQNITWDTNSQTKARLMKQDANVPGPAVEESDGGDRSVESGNAPNLSKQNASPHSLQPMWARCNEDSHRPRLQEPSILGSAISSAVVNEMRHLAPQDTRRSSVALPVEDQVPAAPRPTRPAKLSVVEQSCERCTMVKPRIREFISTMQKLETSLGPFGPYQELHDHYREQEVRHDEVPNISEMHHFFDLITEANDLAKRVVHFGPLHIVRAKEERQSKNIGVTEGDSNLAAMKIQFLSESDDLLLKKRRRDSADPRNDYLSANREGCPDSRRHSSTSSAVSDRLPPINFTLSSPDNSVFKLPSMNPPPTPGRHNPSPPGPYRASPPLYNMPSPASTVFQPSSSANITSQPPHHPLSPAPSSSLTSGAAGGAIPVPVAAHTAALQQEVSVKAYALQTLQQEHAKLLAALSRTQKRARALEENQVFAENEISSLADERVRLTDRIAELETEVLEVSKARDEYRNAGVREGKQYVEIVRMASQLELKAAEERRQLVAALAGNNSQARQTSEPGMHMQEAAAGVLENEVRQLRTQCANYELALKDIQQENRRIDDVIATFLSTRAEVEKSLKGVLGREFLQNS